MLKKFLLGGDPSHMAGDGLAVLPRAAQANKARFNEDGDRKGSTTSTSSQGLQSSMQNPQSPSNGPGGSLAIDLTVAPQPLSFSHDENPMPSPKTLKPSDREEAEDDTKKEHFWQDFEVPAELSMVDDSVPDEIRSIIRESFDEHSALQLSRMQSPMEIEAQTSSAPPLTDDLETRVDGPAIVYTQSLASSQGSILTEQHSSVFGKSQESITTVGSDTSDANSQKLVHEAKAYITSPRHLRQTSKQDRHEPSNLSPVSAITGMEAKFQAAKIKSSKIRGIYSLLNRHRNNAIVPIASGTKAVPTPCECTSCFDEIAHHDAVDGLPCRHRYCRPCFAQLVNTAILSEETFPPKCCLAEIPMAVMRKNLPPEELSKFDEKSLEYAVPLANRFYCIDPECTRWIDTRIARRVNGALECPHCASKLCTVCRSPQHADNQDCPQDFGLDATLQEAEQAGWRRCYNCRAMVELNTGCRHITCKCRAQFW